MSRALALWDGYWHRPVTLARPYLLYFVSLAILAFDVVTDLIEHAGRYGVGGFNVAHWAWLDAIQPSPTPGYYAGTVMLAAFGALALVGFGMNRAGTAAVALLYGYGWMMSMLDSYQHHYMLSILLACFVAFPAVSIAGVFLEDGAPITESASKKTLKKARVLRRYELRTAAAPAYVLMCVSTAIVYFYTGVSKTEEDWRMGATLKRLAEAKLDPLLAAAYDLGISEATFWPLMGHSVVLLQWGITACYLLAPFRDARRRLDTIVGWVGWSLSMSFHLGAEHLDFEIGWFSYYMMVIASLVFLPAPVIRAAALILGAPAVLVARLFANAPSTRDARVLAFGATAAVFVGWTGSRVDIPGIDVAMYAAAAILFGLVVTLAVKDAAWGPPLRLAASALVSSFLLLLALTLSDARYEYWRFVGGEARRRGEREVAVDAYTRAERYAPDADTRERTRNKLRRIRDGGRAASPSSGGDE